MTLGEKFRRWRRAHKHLNQAEFARALGVSRETVHSIELGRRKGSRETVRKFMELRERHGRQTGSNRPQWR